MMLELISRLAFIITVNCYLLGVAATAFSSPALSAEKNYDRLNGAHLKFAVAHVPPSNVLTKGPDGSYTHTGSSALFIDWLARKLNFTFTYLYIPNNTLGAKYENMSEIAILLSLLNNKSMDQLLPAIAIAGVGLGLATMAFFMENCISCYQRMALAFRNSYN